MKMTVDICKSVFRTLARREWSFPTDFSSHWSVAYLRLAEDTIMKYEADAAINGLEFDRHEEAKAVEAFGRAITIAAAAFMGNPMGSPLIRLEPGDLSHTRHPRYAQEGGGGGQ